MAWSREENLIAEIEGAFAGIQLEDGVSLNITEYNDSGGSAQHFADQARLDERDNWRLIKNETLEEFRVTFSFTDLKGFRFYIPAYMIWTIRNHRTSDSIIGDMTIYAIDPDHYLFRDVSFTKWLTERQISAMVSFLEYCCDVDSALDSTVANTDLRKIQNCVGKT